MTPGSVLDPVRGDTGERRREEGVDNDVDDNDDNNNNNDDDDDDVDNDWKLRFITVNNDVSLW